MKRFIKNNLKVFVAIIITTIIVGSVSVYAATTYFAKDISFTPSDNNKANGFTATNVEDALNELYKKSSNSLGTHFKFKSSMNKQNFNLGFSPNYIACVVDFVNNKNYVNITYNKDFDANNVVRSNGASSEKQNLNTWFTITDSGLIWNINTETWNNIDIYCFAN